MAYEVTCKICGKTFIGRNKNSCTCSVECRKKSQVQYNKTYRELTNKTSKIRTCPVCGKNFEQEMAHQILCSRECADVREKEQAQEDRQKYKTMYLNKKAKEKQCVVCGKLFKTPQWNTVTCSKECHAIRENDRKKQRQEDKELVSKLLRKAKLRNLNTLSRINELARKEHLSYGQYVAKHDL